MTEFLGVGVKDNDVFFFFQNLLPKWLISLPLIFMLQTKSQCQFPCKCSNQEIKCHAGVNTVKDGCDCCYMCARQQGDLCGLKDMCDEKNGFYCDFSLGSLGICRGKLLHFSHDHNIVIIIYLWRPCFSQ